MPATQGRTPTPPAVLLTVRPDQAPDPGPDETRNKNARLTYLSHVRKNRCVGESRAAQKGSSPQFEILLRHSQFRHTVSPILLFHRMIPPPYYRAHLIIPGTFPSLPEQEQLSLARLEWMYSLGLVGFHIMGSRGRDLWVNALQSFEDRIQAAERVSVEGTRDFLSLLEGYEEDYGNYGHLYGSPMRWGAEPLSLDAIAFYMRTWSHFLPQCSNFLTATGSVIELKQEGPPPPLPMQSMGPVVDHLTSSNNQQVEEVSLRRSARVHRAPVRQGFVNK
ncbi:hypothetical protein CEUSTIGMA_g2649.t1 [Chlamydomonas eustigma]|uniref:Uncharacterized protein n=1 Tax=Chlamydomonas eustigma TaxID=1157962 RepID=A0A250WWN1_9CHLO|nr:hypothetical protein CEUSTIGMA_g2649.t1 [Chlamydomonas eustigma]|eukprot:GAX75205.1 hypothetical protein CEUSTIGMA_g2649.t1 [Chlamydomonas eustigma]